MADMRDRYGNVVYRIEGDTISDTYGNRKFIIRGEYIFDTYGTRKYEIRGGDLFDTYGNRLGEMKNLADFLEPPGASGSSGSSSGGGRPSSEYENNAGGGSFENKMIEIDGQYYPKQLYQAAQGLVSKLFGTNYADADQRKRLLDEEVKQMIREGEIRREREAETKKAWKKKRKIFYGLGGLIGGLVFTFLPMLDMSLVFEILLGIAIVSIIVFSILSGEIWWSGLIGGVVIYFIIWGIYMLSKILPFQAIGFPIGFIFGTLIILYIRKEFYNF